MSEFDIFIFACLNFAALVALLLWGLRTSARQFFYARRATLKKMMVAAARERREARLALGRSRRLAASLEADIAERRRIMAGSCHKECDAVLAEARRRGEQVVASARRQMQEERLRASQAVRAQVLEEAFRRAEKLLREAPEAERRRAIDGGIADVEELVRSRRNVAAGEAR